MLRLKWQVGLLLLIGLTFVVPYAHAQTSCSLFCKSVTIDDVAGNIRGIDQSSDERRYLLYVTDTGEVGAVDLWRRKVVESGSIGVSDPVDFGVVSYATSTDRYLKGYAVTASAAIHEATFQVSEQVFLTADSITLGSSGSATMLAKTPDEKYLFAYQSTDSSVFVLNTQSTQDSEANLVDFEPSDGAETDLADPFPVDETAVDIAVAPSGNAYHFFLLEKGSSNSNTLLNVYEVTNLTQSTPGYSAAFKPDTDLTTEFGHNPSWLSTSENGQRIYIFNELESNRGGSIVLVNGSSFDVTSTLSATELAEELGLFTPDSVTVFGVFSESLGSSSERLLLSGSFRVSSFLASGIALIPSSFVTNKTGTPSFLEISGASSTSSNPILLSGDGFLAAVVNGGLVVQTDNPIVKITQALTKASFTTSEEEKGTLKFQSDEAGSYTISVQKLGSSQSATVASGSLKSGEDVSFELSASDLTSGEGTYEIVIAVTDTDDNVGHFVVQAVLDNCPLSIPNVLALSGDRNVTIEWDSLTSSDTKEYRVFFRQGSLTRDDVVNSVTDSNDCAKITNLISGFNVSSLGEDENSITIGDITMVIVAQPEEETDTNSDNNVSTTDDNAAFAQDEEVDLDGQTGEDETSSQKLSVKIKGLKNGIPYGAIVIGVDDSGKLSGDATEVSAIPDKTFGAAELSGEGGCGIIQGRKFLPFLCFVLFGIFFMIQRNIKKLRMLFWLLALSFFPPFVSSAQELETFHPALENAQSAALTSEDPGSAMPEEDLNVSANVSESTNKPRFTLDLIQVGWFVPTADNVKDVYGQSWLERYMIGFGYRLKPWLKLDLGTGFFKEKGNALTLDRQRSGDSTGLILVPTRIDASYHYFYDEDAWIVPFVGVGLDGFVWTESREPDTRLTGLNFGYHGRAGFLGLLDPLGRSSANRLKKTWGIDHTYLSAQVEYSILDNFGQNGLDLSGLFYSFGIQFAF